MQACKVLDKRDEIHVKPYLFVETAIITMYKCMRSKVMQCHHVCVCVVCECVLAKKQYLKMLHGG